MHRELQKTSVNSGPVVKTLPFHCRGHRSDNTHCMARPKNKPKSNNLQGNNLIGYITKGLNDLSRG